MGCKNLFMMQPKLTLYHATALDEAMQARIFAQNKYEGKTDKHENGVTLFGSSADVPP